MNTIEAKKELLAWTKKNRPWVYAVAMRRLELENDGLGAMGSWANFGANVGKAFSAVASTAAELAPAYMQYRQQDKIMDMQLRRASQGLPPANVQDIKPPPIQVQHSTDAQTQQAITDTAIQVSENAADKMKIPLMIGAGLIAAKFIL